MRNDLPENAAALSFEELPGLYIHPNRTHEWLTDLPAHVGLELLGCQRLTPRLSLLIRQHYQLSPVGNHDALDLAIAMLDLNGLTSVQLLAGAIFHGHRMRTLISKALIAELLSGLDDWAYNLAVTCADLRPSDASPECAPPLTKEMVSGDGHLCFRAWLDTLPAALAGRIALKFPDNFENDPLLPDFELYGPDIVRAAGRELLRHDRC